MFYSIAGFIVCIIFGFFCFSQFKIYRSSKNRRQLISCIILLSCIVIVLTCSILIWIIDNTLLLIVIMAFCMLVSMLSIIKEEKIEKKE